MSKSPDTAGVLALATLSEFERECAKPAPIVGGRGTAAILPGHPHCMECRHAYPDEFNPSLTRCSRTPSNWATPVGIRRSKTAGEFGDCGPQGRFFEAVLKHRERTSMKNRYLCRMSYDYSVVVFANSREEAALAAEAIPIEEWETCEPSPIEAESYER